MSRKNNYSVFLFLLAVSAILLFFGINGVGQTLTNPIKTAFYRAGQKISSGFSYLVDLKNLQSLRLENEKLKAEILALYQKSVRGKILEDENLALRKQLEAPLPPEMKFLPAKTLGLTRFLEIDKGSEDGVMIGQTVVSENVLIGKISSVGPHSAKIILPLDPDAKIGVTTLQTHARGLVIGEFGTKIILDKVLQAEKLEEGDLVITTGDGGYVRDLLVGKITKIQKREVEPFQKAEIIPALDYAKLENLFIIK